MCQCEQKPAWDQIGMGSFRIFKNKRNEVEIWLDLSSFDGDLGVLEQGIKALLEKKVVTAANVKLNKFMYGREISPAPLVNIPTSDHRHL